MTFSSALSFHLPRSLSSRRRDLRSSRFIGDVSEFAHSMSGKCRVLTFRILNFFTERNIAVSCAFRLSRRTEGLRDSHSVEATVIILENPMRAHLCTLYRSRIIGLREASLALHFSRANFPQHASARSLGIPPDKFSEINSAPRNFVRIIARRSFIYQRGPFSFRDQRA